MSRIILLTGATGTIGKLLLEFLNEKSTTEELTVRIIVRNVEKARENVKNFEKLKFEFVEGDLNDLDSLKDPQEVFNQIERLFILTIDSPDKSDIETRLAELALEHSPSLEQIVKFSALGASEDCETNSVFRWQGEAEKSLIKLLKNHNKKEKNHLVSLVLIRPNLFMQNLLWNDELESIKGGFLIRPDSNPTSLFHISHVDARDIAELISIVLLEKDHKKHGNQTYNITGPMVLTYEEIATMLSNHSGKEITYQAVPESYYADILKQAQLPNEFIWTMLKLYQTYKWNPMTRLIFSDFQIITGKPQRSFEQFLSDYQFSLKLQ
ncbi:predicted protein [Naegleria gruberi]|uniref:Predicted protein n=1 Tax=Naegleria gruberi TaxID=5762 RepID=D2VZG3_NAEGR|nr:uncharacterized protein NAEGRDRAFT_53491 [Naegleria gruberi]EFC37787.1 predicted protein [Naegleria gruberi]|eukprot:XP_002670531.1 predicted protein [Naegleria gruberi strain NEG-M]